MSAHEIEALALQLPPEQRAALAQHLLASLGREDEEERAWLTLSLRAAMHGLEDEPGAAYAETDLVERFS